MALGLPDPRRQFRVLLRDFLARMVDLELLSSRGDIQRPVSYTHLDVYKRQAPWRSPASRPVVRFV